MSFLRSIIRTYVTDLRHAIDREAAERKIRPGASDEIGKRLFLIFLGATFCLFFVRFAGDDAHTEWARDALDAAGLHGAGARLSYAMTNAPDARLWHRVWWAAGRVIGYGAVPLVLVKLGTSEPLTHFGVRISGAGGHVHVYAVLLVGLAPFIFAASYGHAFQAKYPYYQFHQGEPLWPGLVLWELLYAAQFVSLEFFFRGFIVHGLRDSIGYAALLAPIAPYAMIHFAKPLPEALSSIVAGLVLGTMSLKTRSIWGGAALHIAAASSMDMLSLWHRGLL
jgi:CAAX protease family protein